jgi:hypothetical protein
MRFMLRVSRRGLFRYQYDLTEDDRPVTQFTGFRREGCEFTLAGETLRVGRERSRRFVLDGPGGRIATADRESGRRWTITTPASRFELVRPSVWRSAWEMHHGGRAVGRIEQDRGFFVRTSHADLPADLPLPVRVFAFYVVLILWERANAAAAAGA